MDHCQKTEVEVYCDWRGEHQDQERVVCLRDSYNLPHHLHCC